MEIGIEAYRKLQRLISTLPEDLAYELLSPIGLTDGIQSEKRVEFLDNHQSRDWTNSDYKSLWSAAELSNFFTLWLTPYKVSTAKLSLKSLRSRIKHDELNNDNLIALELSFDPLIFFIARTPTSYRAMLDKTITSEDIRDSAYWVPELGIILTKFHNDDNGKIFREILEKQVTGDFEDFRIKSLVVTKLFDTDRNINELVVGTDPMISGFNGLDQINFVGPDVKMGLAGLYRRHDIKTNLHQIGPYIAVENKNIQLKIGSKLQIKSIEGIVELHLLMYPEFYPTDEQINEIVEQFNQIKEMENQIMQIKRDNYENLENVQSEIESINKEIDKIKIVKLADVSKRWKLDQFRVEYRLGKAI